MTSFHYNRQTSTNCIASFLAYPKQNGLFSSVSLLPSLRIHNQKEKSTQTSFLLSARSTHKYVQNLPNRKNTYSRRTWTHSHFEKTFQLAHEFIYFFFSDAYLQRLWCNCLAFCVVFRTKTHSLENFRLIKRNDCKKQKQNDFRIKNTVSSSSISASNSSSKSSHIISSN